jgi:hypothetical protein
MFGVGVWMYTHVTRPRDRIGRWGFLGMTAFLLVGFVANGASPPPPSVSALWVMALALIALVLGLAWWVDTHRESTVISRQSSGPD